MQRIETTTGMTMPRMRGIRASKVSSVPVKSDDQPASCPAKSITKPVTWFSQRMGGYVKNELKP